MKKIMLKWSQNRKAPNKAIDSLRTELSDFCQLFNSAPFEVDGAIVDDQKGYVTNVVRGAIERMERISRIKKGALRMSVSRPNEGLKESYIWLIWGTDNGGCNLATIVMKNIEEVNDVVKGGEYEV